MMLSFIEILMQVCWTTDWWIFILVFYSNCSCTFYNTSVSGDSSMRQKDLTLKAGMSHDYNILNDN